MTTRGDRALETLIDLALEEDVGSGDVTSLWTVRDAARGRARIVARAEGVVAGRRAADRVFARVDPDLLRTWRIEDGARVARGDEIVRVAGSMRAILAAERTALNVLARLSGIATAAARFVAAVEGTGATIIDTRKTTPGWRALEKAATVSGGAGNHRMGLYDMVLIKENHIRAAGGISAALEAVAAPAEAAGITVEIEVRDLDELEEALAHRPDRILLDNMDESRLRRAVERAAALGPARPLLEASGGVTLDRVRAIARTGVDLISVGSITHSAPALDLSLLVDEGEEEDR